MADDRKSSRKPVSLNDRHYRLLQDLSSVPPKPKPLATITGGEVKQSFQVSVEGRRRFCKPTKPKPLATITGGEVKQSFQVSVEGRRRFCKPTTRGDDVNNDGDDVSAPNFLGIVDFDSPQEEALEEEKPRKIKMEGRLHLSRSLNRENDGVDENDDVSAPNFLGIADFDSPHEESLREEKPRKVKMEGRRRLCKVSARDHENNGSGGTLQDDGGLADIADFQSPEQSETVNGVESNPGVNEIRDILNDLSSKLGLLSIEKKRAPVDSDNVTVDYHVLARYGGNEDKGVLPEYVSAGSSFSPSPDTSDSMSDVSKSNGSVAETASEGYEEESYLPSEVGVCEMKNCIEDEDKDDYEKRECVGQSIVSSDEEKEENEVIIESKRDRCGTRLHNTKKSNRRLNKEEIKMLPERLSYVGRSFVSNLTDEEEEDDDNCIVFSRKETTKEYKGNVGMSKVAADHSAVVDLLDDCEEESVLVDESSFNLTGPGCAFKLPSKIAKILYPHQREGLRWLWSLHCQGKGGILGDDMGLGKTMQICGFLAGLFHSRLIKRALVVAPKTLLSHWIKELSIVGLSGKTREYFGTSTKAREYELQYILQDKGVLLTTYDIVRNNSKSLQGDIYFDDEEYEDGFTWDYMILDEGHLIKNPSTQRAKSLLEIPSAHRIIISGTPIQNNLKELWALFNFCCPGLLGDNKWFKEKYEHSILRGNEKNATDREKRVGSAVAKELRERIQPYFLRRLKNEVFKEDGAAGAKLSKKSEIIVWLRLTNCQRQLYEAFLQSDLVLSAFDGSPLAALTILKKICDHPLLLTKRAAEDVLEGMDSMLNQEDASLAEKLAMHIADVAERNGFEEKHDSVSCKISFILSLLGNLVPKGHSVLIFSQTRKMLNLIQDCLVSNGYKFQRIDGTTKSCDRVKIVNDFQEGFGAPIFLLTSQVGGLGLTLTRADRVIVVDPAWNPSTDNQSVDRAYRIGQKKDVLVYRLMTCGTVEEKIYRKQIFKGGLFKSATEHKEQIRYFSQQDLRELFSLPAQGFDVSLTQQQLHEEHDSQHKMDGFLESHVKFLGTMGIAGVSHHSLLFSKSGQVQVDPEEEKLRRKGATSFGKAVSSTSIEPEIINGDMYAFNPKDVRLNRKSSSPDKVGRHTESEIKEKIKRIMQILGNKVTVSRLPDGGAKLQKQIADLNSELDKLKMEKRTEKEVIDLDDLTGELDSVLNL